MTKICSLCKVEKLLSKEFFNLSKSQKDGFHSYCKDCSKAKWKENYQIKKEIIKENRKLRYSKNKEVEIEYAKTWTANNPDKVHDIKKRHSKKQSKHILERVSKWKKSKPLHARFVQFRCSYPHDELNKLTLEEYIEVYNNFALDIDKYFCNYCKKELTFKETTLDHVVPVSKMGPNTKDNLVIACRSCNTIKGNKILA